MESSRPIPQPQQPHVGATMADPLRERFEGHELAMVLSHYDLGSIEHLRVFPRGSRRSPKIRIKSQGGEFLLKRRAVGQDDPFRVAFAHELQLHLQQRQFPVPGIVGTRSNNSMLQLTGRTYEMFNYVHGVRFDRTVHAAVDVGRALGTMHRHFNGYVPRYSPPISSFHASKDIEAKMSLLLPAISSVEPRADRSAVSATVEYLLRAYTDAAARVEELGFSKWQAAVIHGDWHPGNMLIREGRIAAVFDFDSARLEPRVVDVANGCLQFSMLMDVPEHPEKWPDGLDLAAIHPILKGYDQAGNAPLSRAERQSLSWLMIEALVIESMVPIAATGSFARIPGSAFLQMIERKIKWIRPRAEEIAALKE